MGLKAVSTSGTVSSQTYTDQSPINVSAGSGISLIIVNNIAPTTVNLPAIPGAGQIIVVQDGGNNSNTYNITVQGNGNNILQVSGSTTSYVIGSNGSDVWFNWNGTAWGLLA